MICCKCGGNNILIRFVKNGALIDSSSTTSVSNEFVLSIEYSFFFKLMSRKEHLHGLCKCCQYSWRENTLDFGDIK